MNIGYFDERIINFFKKISLPVARAALFLVFFWFGSLKLFGASSALSLVGDLLAVTIPGVSPEKFFVFLGLWEMAIGLLFLFPALIRIVIPLLLVHLLTTFLPLIFLPEVSWQSFLVPTLVGQYIIKNVLIAALAVGIAAHLAPISQNDQ